MNVYLYFRELCGPLPSIMGRLVWLVWYMLSVLFCIIFSCRRDDSVVRAGHLELLVLFTVLSHTVSVILALIQQDS